MNYSNHSNHTRLEDIQIQRSLKGLILDHAQAIYSWQHPQNHGFVVLTSRAPSATHGERDRIRAHVIIYTAPAFMRWVKVRSQSSTSHTDVAALQELLKEMEMEFEGVTGMLDAQLTPDGYANSDA